MRGIKPGGARELRHQQRDDVWFILDAVEMVATEG